MLLWATCITMSQEIPLQDTTSNGSVSDTTGIVTLEPDSTRDSVLPAVLYTPVSSHGSADIMSKTANYYISKDSIQETSYMQLSDILYDKTNFYPLNLGGYGLYNHISIFGADPRGINFAYNGRPINDLNHGSLNLEQISPESFETLEIFTGSDAVILGDNAQGAFVNIQQKKYNTAVPFSRLWYAQAGFGLIASDGIFSQNFSPNWNFSFGFRSLSTDGRYDNQWVEAWNVRAALRWNLSDMTSITLTENFTNHGMGTNGGVNRATSPLLYDELVADVIYDDLNERLYRHDLTLSLTSLLDEDSLSAISLNAYFSRSEWLRTSGNDFYINYVDSSDQISYFNSAAGINGKYEFNFLDFFFLNAGGKIENIDVAKSAYNEPYQGVNYSAYGKGRLKLGNAFYLTGGGRLSYLYGKTAVSFGSAAILDIAGVQAKFDLSISQRISTPSEGLSLDNENHLLGIFSIDGDFKNTRLNIYGFARYVDSPIMHDKALYNIDSIIVDYDSYNAEEAALIGGGFSINYNLSSNFSLGVKSLLQYNTLNGNNDKRYPLFCGNFTFEYNKSIAGNKLKAGISIGLISEFTGYRFSPQRRVYIPAETASSFANNGINLYGGAVLGDAYIKVEFSNLLSQGYYYVPYYPGLSRNLKLSVAWSFLN